MKKMLWIFPTLFTLSLTNFAYAQIGAGSVPKFYSDFKPVLGG
jgi:hypothetical protein